MKKEIRNWTAVCAAGPANVDLINNKTVSFHGLNKVKDAWR